MSVTPQVAKSIANIESLTSDKASLYQNLIQTLPSISSPENLLVDYNAITDSFSHAQMGGIVATRSVIQTFIDKLRSTNQPDLSISVGQHLLDALDTLAAASSVIEQVAEIRELIACAHEANEDFALAAKTLTEIPVDTPQRKLAPGPLAAVWVRIVRNYLEVDDTVAADIYLGKLIHIMHAVDDPELLLHYSLSSARVLDATRRFPDAAARYMEVSVSPIIAEEERLHTLSMAIKCGILAPAGPERTSLLGRLYRDERSKMLPEHAMLEKMYLQRFISPSEIESFAKTLQPHQLALTADGSTVLARAVVEHNLLGASRLYANISFPALGELLHLTPERAETTTARMIEQGRLVGSINQLDSLVVFEKAESATFKKENENAVLSHKDKGRATVRNKKHIKQWDSNIQGLSEEIENITDSLQQKFPEFVASNLKV
ncbi:hypothetical protein Cpir12675_005883 [Ceratocystis pirilliformis]|uniref:COP9 signalosome complex subunit 4 n=1 Tax=Ceratocystis pirilliformis TaxID=259994 RepID=A0ABR3YM03_9PEZI